MTPQQFREQQIKHNENLVEAYELLKKKPEAYSDDGTRLRELIEEIQSFEEWQRNFRAELIRWKHRAE